MSEAKVGAEVVAQANDKSIWNTDPLVAKAAVVGATGSILLALGAFGLVSEDQRTIIVKQVGDITYGLFVVLPLLISIVTALWARLSVYAPRTVARIALINAAKPAGALPTLAPPP